MYERGEKIRHRRFYDLGIFNLLEILIVTYISFSFIEGSASSSLKGFSFRTLETMYSKGGQSRRVSEKPKQKAKDSDKI